MPFENPPRNPSARQHCKLTRMQGAVASPAACSTVKCVVQRLTDAQPHRSNCSRRWPTRPSGGSAALPQQVLLWPRARSPSAPDRACPPRCSSWLGAPQRCCSRPRSCQVPGAVQRASAAPRSSRRSLHFRQSSCLGADGSGGLAVHSGEVMSGWRTGIREKWDGLSQ